MGPPSGRGENDAQSAFCSTAFWPSQHGPRTLIQTCRTGTCCEAWRLVSAVLQQTRPDELNVSGESSFPHTAYTYLAVSNLKSRTRTDLVTLQQRVGQGLTSFFVQALNASFWRNCCSWTFWGYRILCLFCGGGSGKKTTETRAKSIRAGDAPAPILRVVTGQCSGGFTQKGNE